jgi:hypothetical protein
MIKKFYLILLKLKSNMSFDSEEEFNYIEEEEIEIKKQDKFTKSELKEIEKRKKRRNETKNGGT